MANGLPFLPKGSTVVQAALAYAEGQLWAVVKGSPVWGIFDADGNAIAVADSVVSVDYSNESKVTGAPVQAGSFATYNKVASPYDAVVRLSKGGSESERTDFLAAVEAAGKTTTLYSVVTPEKTYTNANIVKVGYARHSDSGHAMILIDVALTEIRQVTPKYTTTTRTQNAKNATATSAVSQGKVQPQPPTSLLKSATKGFLSATGLN